VAGGGLSAWFQGQADRVAGWLNDRGAGPLALVLGVITVAAIAAVVARRPSRRRSEASGETIAVTSTDVR
jgi:hypothetical protein